MIVRILFHWRNGCIYDVMPKKQKRRMTSVLEGIDSLTAPRRIFSIDLSRHDDCKRFPILKQHYDEALRVMPPKPRWPDNDDDGDGALTEFVKHRPPMLWLGVEMTPKTELEIRMEAMVGERKALADLVRYEQLSSEARATVADILDDEIPKPCLPLRDSKIERALRSVMPVAELAKVEIERFLKAHFPDKSSEDIEVMAYALASREYGLSEENETLRIYIERPDNARQRLTLPFDRIPPL